MSAVDELRALLAAHPGPACATLTPFDLLEAGVDGVVRVLFAPQPAFANHFGHVQGGFAVAMIDVCVSLAAFAKTRVWLPTVSIQCSFLAPLPVGPCIGLGRVVHAGRRLAFMEASLHDSDELLAVHAMATASVPQG